MITTGTFIWGITLLVINMRTKGSAALWGSISWTAFALFLSFIQNSTKPYYDRA